MKQKHNPINQVQPLLTTEYILPDLPVHLYIFNVGVIYCRLFHLKFLTLYTTPHLSTS